jgi:hypothetical protein
VCIASDFLSLKARPLVFENETLNFLRQRLSKRIGLGSDLGLNVPVFAHCISSRILFLDRIVVIQKNLSIGPQRAVSIRFSI